MSDSANYSAPKRAMVLAAGMGSRMRPITDTIPKPLVKVAGKALLDYVLDRLADAGVDTAVVNIHHFAEQMERHLAVRQRPRIVISDERPQLLGTGGAVVKALAEFGSQAFFHVNADTIWIDGGTPNFSRLAQAFDARSMDALLLLAPTARSIGYAGRGDYTMAVDGRLRRRTTIEGAPFVFAGAAILSPALFEGAPTGEFALTALFDRAAATGRLHGLPLDGVWMHVGTPDAIGAAEAAIKAHSA